MPRMRVLALLVVLWWLPSAARLHALSERSESKGQGGVPGPAAPPAAPASANMWDWSALGALRYNKTYTGTMRLSNNCKVPATFKVTPEVPGMTHSGDVSVAPGGSMDVVLTLRTLNRPAAPTEIDRTDRANPVRRWRAAMRGRIRVAYAGYEDSDYVCHGTTGITLVFARLEHAELVPQKEKLARADDCTVWWNTGQRPPNNPTLSEEQCVETIRKLAADYRERALAPLAKQDPQKWAWLPSPERIGSMSISELLAMKARAAELLGNKGDG